MLLWQVILEEFGKFINATVGADMDQRNQYYGIIFDEINTLTDAGKPIKASLFNIAHTSDVGVQICALHLCLKGAQSGVAHVVLTESKYAS